MAKYEAQLSGGFDSLIQMIDRGILSGSLSAHLEDSSDFRVGTARCAVRVYERYSVLGKNRLSLSVTLFGAEKDPFVCAISAGGSQAMFLKINTFGEESFLSSFVDLVAGYRKA